MEIPLVYEFESEEELLAHTEPPERAGLLGKELFWLYKNAEEEELPRILTSVVLLWHAGHRPLSECLHTAIVWERG